MFCYLGYGGKLGSVGAAAQEKDQNVIHRNLVKANTQYTAPAKLSMEVSGSTKPKSTMNNFSASFFFFGHDIVKGPRLQFTRKTANLSRGPKRRLTQKRNGESLYIEQIQ